ncbi:hypothetical protein [Arenimonas sp.]|uniref:DUF4376 domain-containing protein n=1 Tax=Arenimonas sp. TaxID=1872635 RepID=UPI0025B9B3F3|nr:hypothetical protein [Arenimonas sp.]
MARYWIRRGDGSIARVVDEADPRLTDMRFDLTPELATLPGPAECCVWTGSAMVVDPARLADFKAQIADHIDRLAAARVALQVTTPAGTFRIRRDDIERYIGIGFAALFARLTSAAFSISVRDVDNDQVVLNADQTLRLLAAIGQRYYAVFQQAETRKAQLAAATAEQLRDFDPADGIG